MHRGWGGRVKPWLIPGVLAGLVIAAALPIRAQNAFSREPILRIETGTHSAVITGIAVESSGKFLVTVANDKTARVWEIATGRLLRVLRVPLTDGSEGKLYAVALAPDARTIAAGGFTRGAEGFEVYLFDRESGRMVRRLSGLENVVNSLAFSPDGARLVATVADSGLRVWRTSDWTEAGRDTACAEDSIADFDTAGRLVTTCYDAKVRLYDRALRLLRTREAPGGRHPYGVKFSPDGRAIAVGYTDTATVDVLSGDTLEPLYRADSADANNDLSAVAWSADGKWLYAGGTADTKVGSPIRRWSDGGRGAYVDTSAGDGTVFTILPLPSGGVVYALGGAAWGILDANHQRVDLHLGQIADYRNNKTGFLTDATGSVVRFAFEVFGESPAVFRLTDRSLTLDPATVPGLAAPRIEAPGLAITGWDGGTAPRLNSMALEFQSNEVARRLAILPKGDRFVIGTEFSLRMYDSTGKQVWRAPAPGISWGVNVSGDGQVVLASYGDGTIRWYRATDGKPLLAFFPHADRKRWVLWTPSGYYDASPGGEDLIGWHVNNGPDQAADFFPASQFRATYYRPDVVAQILATGDETRALQLANAAAGRTSAPVVSVTRQLPPVVDIVSPADGTDVSDTTVRVRFTVRLPSGEPTTGVRALVDGRPAAATLQAPPAGAAPDAPRELRVTIPERDCEIAVIAENRFAASVPATVRLTWRSSTARGVVTTTPRGSFTVKPKLYMLAIGVSRYGNPSFNLGFAAKDARDFVATMRAQKDLLYRDVVVYKDGALTDAEATRDDILDGLDWIRKETSASDVAMVFWAGHGANDQSNDYYFWPFNIDPDRLLRTGLPSSDLNRVLRAIAGKALFFIDTCHSGNALGLAARRGPVDINIVINELASAQNGAVAFSASTGSESSYERPEWNNGAFTKALIEGLTGQAAMIQSSPAITFKMLDLYVSERVKELTKGQQHPTMISPNTVPDFPIAIKR